MSRNQLQIPVLLGAIEEFQFDCCIGARGATRKSVRRNASLVSDAFGQWDQKNQRPEIWNLYNARLNPGENMRVFPLSNWTETDVWEYIKKEELEVPNIYFSHERECLTAPANGCRCRPRMRPTAKRIPTKAPGQPSRRASRWSAAYARLRT